MKKIYLAFERVLEKILAPTSLSWCIYDYTNLFKSEFTKPHYTIHTHPFCNYVKNSIHEQSNCVFKEHQFAKSSYSANSLWEEVVCKSGIFELVFPVRVENKLLFSLLIGPYTKKGEPPQFFQEIPEHELKEIVNAMAILSPETIDDIGNEVGLAIHALKDHIKRNYQNENHTTLSIVNKVIEEISFYPEGAFKLPSEINKAIEIVKNNITEEISASAICKELGITTFRFSHKFKEAMGVSFSTYYKNIKLSLGKKLLKKTELPIGEIAVLIGYTNPISFTTLFKKETGLSPSSYRERNIN